MIDLINSSKNILVLGYGVSGKSVLQYLKQNGHNVYIYDDNKDEYIPNRISNINWENIDIVVKSPAIHIMPHNIHPIIKEALAHNKLIISTFDIFSIYNPNAKIIAVTGTNGKSTVVSMLYLVLKRAGFSVALGGNIGTPYCDLKKADYYIFEMSSYELASSKYLKFYIGAIVNIEPDHLDFHGSLKEYIAAKHKILDSAEIKLISYEDKYSIDKYRNKAITISKENNLQANYYIDEGLLLHNRKVLFDLSSVTNICGRHNSQNISFVYAICSKLGISNNIIQDGIKHFSPLPHRINNVRKINNILFVNDSKATNPSAAAKALESFSGYVIFWLAGGKSKNIDPIPYVSKYFGNIRKIYLFGESKNELAQYFRGMQEFEICSSMSDAILKAYRDASKEIGPTVVLLSPMCASFDQFESFKHRGNVFTDLVNKI